MLSFKKKGLRKFLCYSALSMLFSYMLFCEQAASPGNFRWALETAAQAGSFHKLSRIELTKEQVREGVRFYFTPISNSYLYFFSLSASANPEFRLIFPRKSFQEFNRVNYYYGRHEFSETDIWPFMDIACSETYALVSTKRLREFEKLITDYRKSGQDGKQGLFFDILMYIDNLRSLKYLFTTDVQPWENSSIPSRESGEKMPIGVTAVRFTCFFEKVFKYECE